MSQPYPRGGGGGGGFWILFCPPIKAKIRSDPPRRFFSRLPLVPPVFTLLHRERALMSDSRSPRGWLRPGGAVRVGIWQGCDEDVRLLCTLRCLQMRYTCKRLGCAFPRSPRPLIMLRGGLWHCQDGRDRVATMPYSRISFCRPVC